jgi:hypothetical protein
MNIATIVISEASPVSTAIALDASKCDERMRVSCIYLSEIIANIVGGEYDRVIDKMQSLKESQRKEDLNS